VIVFVDGIIACEMWEELNHDSLMLMVVVLLLVDQEVIMFLDVI
jgi:hypothetical protein